MSRQPAGRLRTAMDPHKAFQQYDELKRSGRLKRALIIAEKHDGSFSIYGQMTDPAGCAQLCMVAADALAQVPEEQRGVLPGLPRPASPPPPVTPAAPKAGKPVLSIASAWAAFDQAVLDPSEIGVVQRREMRRAFYAGARELLNTIMVGLDPGKEPTDADYARMDNLHAELEGFLVDLNEGRA
jgi:hypothetical protein